MTANEQSSPAPSADLSPARVVDLFLERIEACDVTGAVALMAPDCEYDNVPMGKIIGPEAIAAALRPMLESCSEIDWPVSRQVTDETTVFNERLDRFHLPHGWVEMPVTGVWEVRDGLITLWRDYFDEATYRNQLPPKAGEDVG